MKDSKLEDAKMKSDRAQVAHLMRRAGFGATPAELDKLTAEKTYEEIVEDLVEPERFPELDQSYIERYYGGEPVAVHVGKWIYRMANTPRPLEEKMSLFLHHIFPVAWGKSEHGPSLYTEIEMFRRVGMTDMRTILLELSRDPAMIFWLDNNENHKDEINENYGRELPGTVLHGASATTRKTTSKPPPAPSPAGRSGSRCLCIPNGHYPAEFEFVPEDHDYEDKTFLGETGAFDGDDIIDIIVKQPATARFISRHLYNFFVEDEVQVPSWNTEPSRDEAAIQQLSDVFMETGGQMRPVLRALFNSDFFKNATAFKKVKSPTELVVGVLRQTGEFANPTPGIHQFAITTLNGSPIEGPLAIMGQRLMNPPTVEGWHTGHEWIDSGTLSERIGFVESQFEDLTKPGVRDMVERVGSLDDDPTQLVERCLDLLGGIHVSEATYESLIEYASELNGMTEERGVGVHNLLQMTASTVDYQFE